MHEITPEMRKRFLRFREVYECRPEEFVTQGAAGHVVASGPWDAATEAVPLERWELQFYKQLVAMHSVNGGELFGNHEESD